MYPGDLIYAANGTHLAGVPLAQVINALVPSPLQIMGCYVTQFTLHKAVK